MTTLACDGNTVAADSMIASDNMILPCEKKLLDLGNAIAGITGSSSMLRPVVDWIIKGGDPTKYPTCNPDTHFSVLIFAKDCAVLFSQGDPYPDIRSYPCAFGSGYRFAIAAMLCDKNPSESVLLASRLDPSTNSKVMSYTLHTKTWAELAKSWGWENPYV